MSDQPDLFADAPEPARRRRGRPPRDPGAPPAKRAVRTPKPKAEPGPEPVIILPDQPLDAAGLHAELRAFSAFGTATEVLPLKVAGVAEVPVYVNEYWTSRQRQVHSLQEISYRACFKPQLPAFFIDRLTRPGAVVYDPFMGRGTTLVEAALRGRVAWGCDVNPVSAALVRPRLDPPDPEAVAARLKTLPLTTEEPLWDDLLVFYHPETLAAITALRTEFQRPDPHPADAWIRMVATNRLTGHSSGFFSVYTLPPNQAVSVKSQIRINEKRQQTPAWRSVPDTILRKSGQLMGDLTAEDRARLKALAPQTRVLTASCEDTPELPAESVDLVVCSPPFLNEVNYQIDNWLRCWFHGLDSSTLPIWQVRKLSDWQEKMTSVLRELRRVLKPDGWIAFEVGEVKKGLIALEEAVLAAGTAAGLHAECVMINAQEFTKTSNCWGVDNQTLGTNTNRIVIFRKSR